MTGTEAARHRLRTASWLGRASPFLEILDGSEGCTRVVGGLVRDTLLGRDRPTSDIDMASVFEPAEVMARAERAGFAVHPTGVEHGTVTLVAKGVSAEVTTLRQDVETFGRRARVVFGTDWTADARRRDFTMNALYCDQDGELFDPVAGLEDCLNRRVRFIGEADQRIAEDRLRVYRYFRFCATHGMEQFDTEALSACRRAAPLLGQLSAERVGAEMLKLLGSRVCAKTLAYMNGYAVLGTDLVGPQGAAALRHLESVSERRSASVRIALLVIGGTALDDLRKRWRLSNVVCKDVELLLSGARLAEKGRIGELRYRFPDKAEDALAVAAAAMAWPADALAKARNELAATTPPVFPLSGADLLAVGIPKGKVLGETLRHLEQLWIDSGFQLDRQALLKHIRLP